jgi:hypothetical protein
LAINVSSEQQQALNNLCEQIRKTKFGPVKVLQLIELFVASYCLEFKEAPPGCPPPLHIANAMHEHVRFLIEHADDDKHAVKARDLKRTVEDIDLSDTDERIAGAALDRIRPHLAGMHPGLQGAVLVHLVGTWVVSWYPPHNREEALRQWLKDVRELVATARPLQ